ncbi:interleukin-23 receptor [Pungitius pungitius]|uniref:interleukin-23 receptor n=1 Tax=Pungitius pungitius TaxID=134920 RepID=UPI002E149973
MGLSFPLWTFMITLLSGSSLPAGFPGFIRRGYLTVEPAPVFRLGSDLTVYCHVLKDRDQEGLTITLELNGETVSPWKKVNSTTMMFRLFNVQIPRSTVLCKLRNHQLSLVVDGLDLHGGRPPDKPGNVLCEMTVSSDVMKCSWERGNTTHILTTYNSSLSREDGTQLLEQVQDATEVFIPRAKIHESSTQELIIKAFNLFGESWSDPLVFCVKDILIPEAPLITQLEFGNHSITALLHWKASGSSENVRADVRLRSDEGFWEVGEGTEVSEGLIQVGGLRPLTHYDFQMRVCDFPSGRTQRASSSRRLSCSRWSPSEGGKSPGKGPSQQIQVWRTFGPGAPDELTVLWKPPSPEDHSGAVQSYLILLGQEQQAMCDAASSQWSLRVPVELQELSVSAVTSYGTSPLAQVPLRLSGERGPVLRELTPAADGTSVSVTWSMPHNPNPPRSGGETLHYVMEWTGVGVQRKELQWKQVSRDQNSTSITGVAAGVRYNVSLYAVSSRGVSALSSELLYSKEQEPAYGPSILVLVHKARRILIQWEEPPVGKQRGFITFYTVYLRTLDSTGQTLSVKVPASEPRPVELTCPAGALALQLTASTSAGEGRRGDQVFSEPESPAVGLVIVMVFILTFFIAIIANMMFCSCMRERVKEKVASWGPTWLRDNLPKVGNSNAIRLLQGSGSEPSFSPYLSDPPLSPISLVSQEDRDDGYPTVHVHEPTPFLALELLEHVGYKPQIAASVPPTKQTQDQPGDVLSNEDEDECALGGLLGDFLSHLEVDSPVGLNFSSVAELLWTKTPEATALLNGGFLQVRNEEEVDSKQDETETPDPEDSCWSQETVGTGLTGGYFPQQL